MHCGANIPVERYFQLFLDKRLFIVMGLVFSLYFVTRTNRPGRLFEDISIEFCRLVQSAQEPLGSQYTTGSCGRSKNCWASTCPSSSTWPKTWITPSAR
jgi:hypothetical protein